MLASLADPPLDDPALVYEPKYDGIRAIAEVEPSGPSTALRAGGVRLWSRLGNEKTRQFPEITTALAKWATRLKAPVILDGEIVALDDNGEPTGFQQLQGRIHLSAVDERSAGAGRVAYIAFDILRDGRTDLRDRPLTERRKILERVFGKTGSRLLRISTAVRGGGRALYKAALEHGWEGLIVKHADSQYKSGKRTPDWRKLKIVHEQEFVIGGWTEPRQTRTYFGALLLGVYEPQRKCLVYTGHTGTGFNEKELARVMKLLEPRETKASPFCERFKTNEPAHWVRPELVAQIKFTEWTTDGKLRHPVYLGLRDDKKPEDVRREDIPRVRASRAELRTKNSELRTTNEERRTKSEVSRTRSEVPRTKSEASRTKSEAPRTKSEASRTKSEASRTKSEASRTISEDSRTSLIEQLRAIEESKRDGVLTLPDGDTLKVTNLQKVFWPKQKLTKGDLFRYYARVAPWILPAVADRPLVMKRLPNGITGQYFYQHRIEDVPPGVRTEVVSVVAKRAQVIGGSLKTLLYTTQLAAISQDPWFSRIQHPEFADYAALDLDPSEQVPFARVLDVARWIRDELDALGALGVPKTSGASGLHVYVPLPRETPYDAGLLFCQIIATVVAQKHPKVATIERSVRARGPRVYVDVLQNILGKTLATAYSARASDYAGVSTPLTWEEVDGGIDPRNFTIQTVPARLEKAGDLWAALRKSKGVDLSKVTRYAERSGKA
jgi:bifunctional non-homologous end joining protein LigD